MKGLQFFFKQVNMHDKIMGDVNDGVMMLKDTNIPLNSFSTISLFGQKGTGKTTL